MPPDTTPASQTLSRGIRILESLAAAGRPQGIDDIAGTLGVHRSIAYRLVRTLEDHGLLSRDSEGRFSLGLGMVALAAGVSRDLQSALLPELTTLANELGLTCFVAVLERDDVIALASVEPQHALTSVSYRPGIRHPVTEGGPGRAILSQLDRARWPGKISAELEASVHAVSAQGYATSANEVIQGLQSVAVPLRLPGHPAATLAVVHVMSDLDGAAIAQRLQRSAEILRERLSGA